MSSSKLLYFRNPQLLKQIERNNSTTSHELQEYVLFKLKESPPKSATCTKEDAIKYLLDMNIIRRMQLAASTMYAEKFIRGFLHLYSGQEAICVGGKAALSPKDTVITSYRAHGWLYVMGASLYSILAELTGSHSGLSKGKGGSMHMYTKNFYGANGIVGGQIPMGTGLGFAHKYSGSGGISLTLYGDGAANQGQGYEAFNMAKLWKLPIVYLCENNQYGMGTAANRSSANTDYFTRGDYIPGIQVNGMDLLSVRESIKFAREYALENGPIILEMKTYRYFGHSMSDPGKSYRTREEVQNVRQTSDPIMLFKKRVLEAELLTEDELKQIDTKSKTIVDEAVAKARKEHKECDLKEIYYDVYAKNLSAKSRKLVAYQTEDYKNTAKEILNLK